MTGCDTEICDLRTHDILHLYH